MKDTSSINGCHNITEELESVHLCIFANLQLTEVDYHLVKTFICSNSKTIPICKNRFPDFCISSQMTENTTFIQSTFNLNQLGKILG